ncbi:hypothetical protein [Euzebya rosea]|uniref:hypothetical protein n=1 Tax=Euzebya rosea TaxID=2052804 RepID=UPI000D3E74DB|nr:hypothetical protein [Euzebya rosea]
MAGFDRIKPPEQRLQDRDEARKPDSDAADVKGRAALFSASPQPTRQPARSGPASSMGEGGPDRADGQPTRSTEPTTPPQPTSPTAGEGVRRRRPDVGADVPGTPPVSQTPPVAPPAGDGQRADDAGAPHDPTAPGPPPGRSVPTGKSLLQVECSHCGVTCPMPLGTAVKRAFPLAVVLPTRSHPVFATCPCGERRTWVKPSVGLPR